MRVVFLGPPGAGKGTQAARFAKHLGVPHISTGEIIRRAIELATPTGVLAKAFVDRGELVPFDIILRMVRDRLQEPDAGRGWVLDGFPRNLDQAAAFSNLLGELRATLDRVVYFHIGPSAVVRRLGGRRTCRVCQAPYHVEFSPPQRPGVCDRCGGELQQRSDDSESSIANRMRVYESETTPLVRHYEQQGVLSTVEADRPIEVVATDLRTLAGR